MSLHTYTLLHDELLQPVWSSICSWYTQQERSSKVSSYWSGGTVMLMLSSFPVLESSESKSAFATPTKKKKKKKKKDTFVVVV